MPKNLLRCQSLVDLTVQILEDVTTQNPASKHKASNSRVPKPLKQTLPAVSLKLLESSKQALSLGCRVLEKL